MLLSHWELCVPHLSSRVKKRWWLLFVTECHKAFCTYYQSSHPNKITWEQTVQVTFLFLRDNMCIPTVSEHLHHFLLSSGNSFFHICDCSSSLVFGVFSVVFFSLRRFLSVMSACCFLTLLLFYLGLGDESISLSRLVFGSWSLKILLF